MNGPRGAVFPVYYGPPSRPRVEGQVEVKEVVQYLGNGRYRVKCVFLGDAPERVVEREIEIGKGGDGKR